MAVAIWDILMIVSESSQSLEEDVNLKLTDYSYKSIDLFSYFW